jgi:hypothetical protein
MVSNSRCSTAFHALAVIGRRSELLVISLTTHATAECGERRVTHGFKQQNTVHGAKMSTIVDIFYRQE